MGLWAGKRGLWCIVAFCALGLVSEATSARPPEAATADVKAASWVSGRSGPVYVELLSDGSLAALRVRSSAHPVPITQPIASPGTALSLLADRHMQFMWAPLIEVTGRDLEQLRTRSLAQLRDSAAQGQAVLRSADTQQSTVRPAVRAVLQLANMLEATGHRDEGLNLLEQLLAKMPLKPNGWSGIEWFSVASAHAALRWHAGDYPDAIAEYSTIEQALSGSPYLLNATVNRAALLAESGHYQDALTSIDAAWAEFLAQTKGDKVPGSERQFAWIRACALNGLGRTDDARREMRVLVDDRTPIDPDFVIPKDNDIELRAAVCMNDVATVTNLIVRDLTGSSVGSKAVVWMQPGFHTPLPAWQAMFDKVRADKRVQDAVAERMRVLPSEFTPALNAWADAGSGANVTRR